MLKKMDAIRDGMGGGLLVEAGTVQDEWHGHPSSLSATSCRKKALASRLTVGLNKNSQEFSLATSKAA
jgi:hypothetical protein